MGLAIALALALFFVAVLIGGFYALVVILERRAWKASREQSRTFTIGYTDRPVVTWTRRPLYDHDQEGDFR